MKHFLWMGLFALISCNTAPKVEEKAETGASFEIVELPLPKSDHTTLKLMFKTGSIDDPEGKKGLTNLTANVIAEGGSVAHSKSEIDEMLYPMAVGFGVTVDKEATVFTTTVHKDNLDKAYGLFSGLLLTPRWDASDFERVKKSALKAISQDIPNNNDEVFSKRALDDLMFANHPYGHLVEGVESHVEAITLEDVKAHFQALFNKNRVTLGLAGGYDDAFKNRVIADLEKLPEGKAESIPLPKVPMPEGIVARVVSKETAFGSAIFMGYPIEVDRASDDFAALMVANSYLGEHRKSYGQLYSKMRSTRSLNYGDYSYIEWYQNGHITQLPLPGTPRRQNFFSIWIRPVQIADQFKGIEGLDPPKLGNGHFVIRQSIRELKRVIDEGLNQEEFDRTRKFLMGYMKLYVQSQSRRLGFLMDSRWHGRDDYITEMIGLLDKLTLEQVNAAVAKYLQAENMYVAVITDDSEAETLATSLRENGSANIVYKPVVKNGLPVEVLEEDAEIDAFKLNVTKVDVVKHDTLFKN